MRKSKTVQADKMRSFQTCFLANMLQDYFHNHAKHKVTFHGITPSELTIYLVRQNKINGTPKVSHVMHLPVNLPIFHLVTTVPRLYNINMYD